MSNMNKVLGIERINERVKRPNALINFIKPLEGPDKALAQDFLERVAAICYPIMKENHIVVMALEEYPPNPKFIGRNFNAGEVIQLVLKAPHTGQWLPFKHVQMVMMHELAHCKQMNHSRAFWKVRNAYSDELQVLWSKAYTGEGLWGKGQSLITGLYTTTHMPEAANAPANLCGGTFRSSGGRKRKRSDDKPKVTYAERQQRRIAKKFGVNGAALGADETTRAKLEAGQKGSKPTVKPRVAGSKRGRELRAAAALARFDNVKKEPKTEAISESDYETDSDYEYLPAERTMNPESDNMVRVCENEDSKDKDAQREYDELREIDQAMPKLQIAPPGNSSSKGKAKETLLSDDASTDSEDDQDLDIHRAPTNPSKKAQPKKTRSIPGDDESTDSEDEIQDFTSIVSQMNKQATFSTPKKPSPEPDTKTYKPSIKSQVTNVEIIDDSTEDETETSVPLQPKMESTTPPTITFNPNPINSTNPLQEVHSPATAPPPPHIPPGTAAAAVQSTTTHCKICSLTNEATAALCAACSHVLNRTLMPNSWSCKSADCQTVGYINPGDYGVCGLCGGGK
jgi:hypothetical protein